MVHFLCVPAANYELERKERERGGREGERKAAIFFFFFFFFQGEPLRGGVSRWVVFQKRWREREGGRERR